MVDTYESVLLVKPEVFIYKIPPSGANQRHRTSLVSYKIAPPPGRSPLVSPAHKPGGTEWGDFATAGGQQQQPQQNTTTNSNWVQF